MGKPTPIRIRGRKLMLQLFHVNRFRYSVGCGSEAKRVVHARTETTDSNDGEPCVAKVLRYQTLAALHIPTGTRASVMTLLLQALPCTMHEKITCSNITSSTRASAPANTRGTVLPYQSNRPLGCVHCRLCEDLLCIDEALFMTFR